MHTLFVTFNDHTASPHLGKTEREAIQDAAMAIGLDGFHNVESAIIVESDERGQPVGCKDAKDDLYQECGEQYSAAEREYDAERQHQRDQGASWRYL